MLQGLDWPIIRDSPVYAYSIDTETNLMNLIRAGRESDVIALLHAIRAQNMEKRYLSNSMWQVLLVELHATLLKLSTELPFETPSAASSLLWSFRYDIEFNEGFQCIIKACALICAAIQRYQKSNSYNLIEKIISFLKTAYGDKSLCLYKVSSRFGLKEGYVSSLFKQQTGQKFSRYLERIRIEEALRLLSNTDLRIKQIADTIGYSSTHVFRRAFKRVQGVMPAVYRSCKRERFMLSESGV